MPVTQAPRPHQLQGQCLLQDELSLLLRLSSPQPPPPQPIHNSKGKNTEVERQCQDEPPWIRRVGKRQRRKTEDRGAKSR